MICVCWFSIEGQFHFCWYLSANEVWIALKWYHFNLYFKTVSIDTCSPVTSTDSTFADHTCSSFHPVSTGCTHSQNRNHRSQSAYCPMSCLNNRERTYAWIGKLIHPLLDCCTCLCSIHLFCNCTWDLAAASDFSNLSYDNFEITLILCLVLLYWYFAEGCPGRWRFWVLCLSFVIGILMVYPSLALYLLRYFSKVACCLFLFAFLVLFKFLSCFHLLSSFHL